MWHFWCGFWCATLFCSASSAVCRLERQLLEQSSSKWYNLELPCDKLHEQDKKQESWFLCYQSGCCVAVYVLQTYTGGGAQLIKCFFSLFTCVFFLFLHGISPMCNFVLQLATFLYVVLVPFWGKRTMWLIVGLRGQTLYMFGTMQMIVVHHSVPLLLDY